MFHVCFVIFREGVSLQSSPVGRYPTGSGARTVVARLPLAPPSLGDGEGRLAARAANLPTTRRSPRAPTRFSSRFLKVPLAPRESPEVGFPSGICEAPTGKSQPSQCSLPSGKGAGSHWEFTVRARAVAASAAASKKAPIRPRLSLFAVTQISRLRCRRVAGLTLRGCSRLS
jgi:hypothetical protein